MENPIYDLLRADGSIVINKRLAHGIGLNEAIVFGELLSRYYYFKEKGQLQLDGSFFNTIDDLMLGTALHERAQRTAITNLEKKNLIKVKVRGAPPKRYFKINDNIGAITKHLKEGSKKIEELKKKHDEKRIPAYAVFESCGRGEFNPAEGSSNNTNLNNTKEIILTLREILENENFCASFDDYKVVLYHYFYRYEEKVGRQHPLLSEESCYDIAYKLFSAEDDIYNKTFSLDVDDLIKMIDKHFETEYKSTDWNIMHFLADGIKFRRMCEVTNKL